MTAREAVAFAVEQCFEQYSVVPERELLRVALLHGMGCVSDGADPRRAAAARRVRAGAGRPADGDHRSVAGRGG